MTLSFLFSIQNYKHCFSYAIGKPGDLTQPYEIINKSNYNHLVWPLDHSGIYVFRVKILDPNYRWIYMFHDNSFSIQFSSVAQLCLTLCDPMNHSMPGLPVHHQLLEFTQTHVHWVGDAIQPSHPLSSPSSPSLNLSQHQSLFQWVNSSHEVARVLEFQL